MENLQADYFRAVEGACEMTIEKEALEIVRYGGSDQFPDPGTAVYIIAKALQKKKTE